MGPGESPRLLEVPDLVPVLHHPGPARYSAHFTVHVLARRPARHPARRPVLKRYFLLFQVNHHSVRPELSKNFRHTTGQSQFLFVRPGGKF